MTISILSESRGQATTNKEFQQWNKVQEKITEKQIAYKLLYTYKKQENFKKVCSNKEKGQRISE